MTCTANIPFPLAIGSVSRRIRYSRFDGANVPVTAALLKLARGKLFRVSMVDLKKTGEVVSS